MISWDDTFSESYLPFLGNKAQTMAGLAKYDAMTDEQRAAKKARMDALMDKAATELFEKHGALKTRPNPYWINRENA